MKQLKRGKFVLNERIVCDCGTTLMVTGVNMLALEYSIGASCPVCKKWHEVTLPSNLRAEVVNRPSGFVPEPLMVVRKAWWDKVVACEGCTAEFQIEHDDVYDFGTAGVSKTKVVRCSECGLPLHIWSSD